MLGGALDLVGIALPETVQHPYAGAAPPSGAVRGLTVRSHSDPARTLAIDAPRAQAASVTVSVRTRCERKDDT